MKRTNAFLSRLLVIMLVLSLGFQFQAPMANAEAPPETIIQSSDVNLAAGITPTVSLFTENDIQLDKELAMMPRLTDGILGDGDWDGSRTLYVDFYRSAGRHIFLNLDQMSTVNEISFRVLRDEDAGIYLPNYVEFSISNDNGATWSYLGPVKAEAALPVDAKHSEFKMNGLNYEANSIRVSFPIEVWVFADELKVIGSPAVTDDALPPPGGKDPYTGNAVTTIAKAITEIPAIANGQTTIALPQVPAGYAVSLFGSDRLPVIDSDGNITTPLVDVNVNLVFQVVDENNPSDSAISRAVPVTVPGLHTQQEHLNKEPKVIPSLREWYGRTDHFVLEQTSRIVVHTDDVTKLQKIAEETKADLLDISGLNLEIVEGTPIAGDIYLGLDDTVQLGDEGYIFDVDDYVSIKSSTEQGVFYGTRTALQIIKQDTEHIHLPKGIAREYPKYETRGLMLDVARKFYTIDFLRDYVKLLSWYKMNTFQIHLNDDVGVPFENGARAAFRLENETYPGLTSTNGSYTKEEFRNLQLYGIDHGVNIIPEIDTPGHSRAFTSYNPDLGSDRFLDISKPETIDFVKSLFDEYIDGSQPTFVGPDVNIGTDEYWGSDIEIFRGYMDTLIRYINDKGKNPHLWGGLTEYNGTTPISTEATMDIWHEPYGTAKQAVELGYDILNVQNDYLYIVPTLYKEYLDAPFLYNEWEPNRWVNQTLPYGHPKLKGGMFALWNDVSEKNGVSMDDSHERMLPAIQVLSEKMWMGTKEDKDYDAFVETASIVGEAPNANLSHNLQVDNEKGEVIKYNFENDYVDSSGNGYDGTATNVQFEGGKLGNGVRLNGGESYIETPIEALGFGWTLSLWIKPDADNSEDAVIMESPAGQLKLKQGSSGKLGFSKENYHSTFDYTVPSEQWTHLTLKGDSKGTSLFVNGNEYIERLEFERPRLQTFVLPMGKIGSTTNSFKGVIDELIVYNQLTEMNSNLALGKTAFSSSNEVEEFGPEKAVDGVVDFTSRWSSLRTDDQWFYVDLEKRTSINQVVIKWQTPANEYKILVSNDGQTWTNVLSDDGIITSNGGVDVIDFAKVDARYVKFQGVSRKPVDGYLYGYSFFEFEVYGANGEEQNLALGKDVELILTGLGTTPYPTDSSISVNEVESQIVNRITDGIVASTAEFEQDWVGKPWNADGARSLYLENYRNIGRELNIDLGQTSHITNLSLHAGYHSGYGIEYPVGLTYYLSNDGNTYYKVGEVKADEVIHDPQKPTGSDPMDHVFYELSDLNYNARYVKIYYEVGVWAFIDEIFVTGTTVPADNADDFTTGDIFLPAPKYNRYAFTDQSKGIQHEMLIYSGWDYSQQPTYKTVDDLIRTITYVDEAGQIKDWLFDSLTFLPHPTLDSEGKLPLYIEGTAPENYSEQTGWLKYIEHTLNGLNSADEPHNLDALDIAAGQAKKSLNDPNKKIGVKMSILPPVHVKDNWGEINGKPIHFTPEASGGNEEAIANRRAAVEWYVNKAIELFEAQNYEHITLDGFYYYDEVIYESLDPLAAATIQEITDVVKTTGKQIYWIPLFQAQGFHKWESFGFDYAIMQPNYAFSPSDTSRLTESAELSKLYGLGVEMELGGAAETSDSYLTKFKEYLVRGSASDLGYQNSSLIGWYMSTNALVDLSRNVNDTRYLYDAVYQFVKGNKIDFSEGISGKPVSLSYRNANLVNEAGWNGAVERAHYLTDGKFALSDRDKHPELNWNYFDNTAVEYDVTLDLEENYDLSALTMSFDGWNDAGVIGPSEVSFSISPDGVSWTKIGVVTSNEAQVVPTSAGMDLLHYTYSLPNELEARYIRASFGHADTWMFLEEISGVGEKSAGKPPFEGNYKKLTDAIKKAIKEKEKAIVSADGHDVPNNKKWVTPSEMNALVAAIQQAENLTATTQSDIDNQRDLLRAATDAFKSAQKKGLYKKGAAVR